ncbi:hypothetical protein F4861DRAFT_497159 [Xylaria intraflava]|nr:hypothetical protein F4861DRAFT_497159 [Xylaria intraflava]
MENNAGIVFVGPFMFTAVFNPQAPEYDAFQVEMYFRRDRIQTADEFTAWRDRFFPNELRCDACYFYRLECVIPNGSNGCANCGFIGGECTFTNRPSNQPPPSNSPSHNASATRAPVAGASPPVEAPNCVNCALFGYANCDMSLDRQYGCTACRKVDVACEFLDPSTQLRSLEPRPDGLLPPLCCDRCLIPPGGILSCSWRRLDRDAGLPCDNCVKDGVLCMYMGELQQNLGNHTHFSRTQHFSPSRPEHLVEQHVNPRLSADAPRADGVQGGSPSLFTPPGGSPSLFTPPNQSVRQGSAGSANGSSLSIPIDPNLLDFPNVPGDGNLNLGQSLDQANPQGSLGSTGLPAPGVPGALNNQSNQPDPINLQTQGESSVPNSSQTLAPETGPSGAAVPNEGQIAGPAPESPVAQVLARRREPCRLCASFPRGSFNYRRCNWTIEGDINNPTPNSKQMGCTICKNYGLVCVVDGDIALPPNPDAILTRRPAFAVCGPCRTERTLCDRQRPCESCVNRGTPDECAGGTTNRRGTFTRGSGFATELYTYMSVMGGGLMGINDREKLHTIFNQPDDIHLQYIRWVEGGLLPVPEGFAATAQTPARPDVQLRSLPFSLPAQPDPDAQFEPQAPGAEPGAQSPLVLDILDRDEPVPGDHTQDYQVVWNTARTRVNNGQIIDLVALRANLRQELFAGTPVNRSVAAQPYLAEGQKICETIPVPIPQGSDEDEIELLGLGAKVIFNVAAVPQLPPSPLPTTRLFDIREDNIFFGDANLPEGHPERADLSLIPAQRPDHPNPSSIPVLQTVPFATLFDQSLRPEILCSELKLDRTYCLTSTRWICEDLSHDAANPVAICEPCHNASYARFVRSVASITMAMRAYACSSCAMTQSGDARNYEGKRLNIWGLPPDALSEHSEFSSKNCGPPLRLTGCRCATKLLDRRLCTPHRLAHFLDMRAKVQGMRAFVNSTLGRMVCPFCLVRAGADAHNFVDEQGIEFPQHAYACMACHGIVIVDAATHAAGINDAVMLMSGNA